LLNRILADLLLARGYDVASDHQILAVAFVRICTDRRRGTDGNDHDVKEPTTEYLTNLLESSELVNV
jgi:hypothetical protein